MMDGNAKHPSFFHFKNQLEAVNQNIIGFLQTTYVANDASKLGSKLPSLNYTVLFT